MTTVGVSARRSIEAATRKARSTSPTLAKALMSELTWLGLGLGLGFGFRFRFGFGFGLRFGFGLGLGFGFGFG